MICHFMLSKLERDVFVLADFITSLPPEKPRDTAFIPLSACNDGGYRE